MMASWSSSLGLCAAMLCVAVMGFAIQRGGTCTVAAVEEVVECRSAWRLLGLVEASLWVAGGLLLSRRLGLLPELPKGHALTSLTLAGAAVLGLGAYINGACVLGSIARIGSGEWAYIATPVGFYLGCLSVFRVLPWSERSLAAMPTSPLHNTPALALWLFAGFSRGGCCGHCGPHGR